MVGILIVAHGDLGASLLQAARHVLGGLALEHAADLPVAPGDLPDALLPRARELLGQLDTGGGVLVFTDMLGATPSNVATRLLQPGRVEGLSGVNLPMLVRALTYRDKPLSLLLAKARVGGAEGVVNMMTDCCNASNRS